MPALTPKKALVISVQHPAYLKCGQISITAKNLRRSVMKQAIRTMAILGDGGSKCGFDMVGAWATLSSCYGQLSAMWVCVAIIFHSSLYIQEKSESVDLAWLEHPWYSSFY